MAGRSGDEHWDDEDCDMVVVVVDTVDIVEGGGGGLEIDRDCLSELSNLGVISDRPLSTTGRLKSISSLVSFFACDISGRGGRIRSVTWTWDTQSLK